MKIPEMILFDYGHTLAYEPSFDGIKGIQALLPYATTNKQGLDASTIKHAYNTLFKELIKTSRKSGIDLHHQSFDQLLYDYLGIHFNLSPLEMEEIYWNNAAPIEVMPFSSQLLEYLSDHHIRTGVISNTSFSSAALTKRLNRLFPNNRFEFIITSSDYIFRKPNPILFQIAINKANLSPSDIWFCGNNPITDLEGAAAVNMFPVWYENELPDALAIHRENYHPSFEHLHITSWQALINHLDALFYTNKSHI